MNILAFRTIHDPSIVPFNPRRSTQQLLLLLQEEIGRIGVVANSEDISQETVTVHIAHFVDGDIKLEPKPQQVSVKQLKGVINGSSIGHDVQFAHQDLRLMNNPALREMSNKGKQIELDPKSFVETCFIQQSVFSQQRLPDSVKDAIGTGGSFVLKPETGAMGKGVIRFESNSRFDLIIYINEFNAQRAANGKLPLDFILQPFSPAHRVPSLKALNAENQKILDSFEGRVELRVFCVVTHKQVRLHVVGRGVDPFSQNPRDEWVLLNPDTVDSLVVEIASMLSMQILEKTHSNIGFIAIDCFYNEEGIIQVREINVKDPLAPSESVEVHQNIVAAFKDV